MFVPLLLLHHPLPSRRLCISLVKGLTRIILTKNGKHSKRFYEGEEHLRKRERNIFPMLKRDAKKHPENKKTCGHGKPKKYKKGEDPIDEWKKRRASGQISDLDDQYGDPKKVGGIPIPGASFGVGGEFGVGGKFDNGGRFDLRLPYADQGYVDEDADVMAKLGNFFSGGKKKKEPEPEPVQEAKEEPKKMKWPWEK